MNRRREAVLLALPATIALTVLFLVPMAFILVQAIAQEGLSDFAEFLTDPFYLDVLATTLRVSLVSTILSLLIGYPVAYYMARISSGFRKVMIVVILFPFLVSAVVRSYGWMVILGTNSLLNQLLMGMGLLSEPAKFINTEGAVVLGMIHLLIPYMILSLVAILQGIDPNVECAADSLGANPFQRFLHVTLPLSLPGIVNGCVLVFTMSMTSYVTPKLLGGSKLRMMATMVVQEVNVNFDYNAATAISYILLATILVVQVLLGISTQRGMARLGGGRDA